MPCLRALGVLLTLKEEGCLVGNQVAGKVLRRVHQAGDDCSSPISAPEKVEEGRRAAQVSLNLNRSLNHGKMLLGIVLAFVAEALDGLEGLFLASATHEPPRRLGSEEDEDEKRSLDDGI